MYTGGGTQVPPAGTARPKPLKHYSRATLPGRTRSWLCPGTTHAPSRVDSHALFRPAVAMYASTRTMRSARAP